MLEGLDCWVVEFEILAFLFSAARNACLRHPLFAGRPIRRRLASFLSLSGSRIFIGIAGADQTEGDVAIITASQNARDIVFCSDELEARIPSSDYNRLCHIWFFGRATADFAAKALRRARQRIVEITR